MKGFDNDVIGTAIKEVAAIAFAGIHVERLLVEVAYLSSFTFWVSGG